MISNDDFYIVNGNLVNTFSDKYVIKDILEISFVDAQTNTKYVWYDKERDGDQISHLDVNINNIITEEK